MAKQDEVSAIKELISQGFDQIIAQQQSLAQGVDNVLMLIFTRKAPDAFDYIDHENPSNSILKTLVAQNIGSLLLDRIKTLKQMCEEQVVYYKKQWEIINSCELGDELNL